MISGAARWHMRVEDSHVKDHWDVAVSLHPSFAPFFRLGYLERCLSSGSDGDRLREIDEIAPPLIPLPCPEQTQCEGILNLVRDSKKVTGKWKISVDRWLEISDRSRSESLRDLAAEFGVSHETIRTILKRIRQHALNVS